MLDVTEMVDSTADQAVRRGAGMLDRYQAENPHAWPVPWYTVVDVGSLDMSSPDRCIIGQLFRGRYCTGLGELGLRGLCKSQIHYGFEAAVRFESIEYADLNRSWLREIANRIHCASSVPESSEQA